MGRYFGITNCTKNESVSDYWKGDSWCSLYSVMHQRGWTHEDSIYSSCYDSCYDFVFDENKKARCCEFLFDVPDEEPEDAEEEEPEEEPVETEQREPRKIFNFSMSYEDRKLTGDHCPEWEGGKCKKCGYKLNLESQSDKNVDTTFFCN